MSENQSPANTTSNPQPSPGIPAVGKVYLHVHEAVQDGVHVDLTGTEGYVLGRSDSKSSYIPDVDLATFRALDKGVSRRHAAFVRYQGKLHIVDLSSVNGTFLNGSRLTPEMPYPLNVGDRLTLGELALVLSKDEN
ncbi:MAG: FHA domain-containing protein [Chloroflexota bacterium]